MALGENKSRISFASVGHDGAAIVYAIAAVVVALMSSATIAAESAQAEQHDIIHYPAWDPRKIELDGTVHVPAFLFPESSLLSDQSRAAIKQSRETDPYAALNVCPSAEGARRAAMPEIRKCQAEVFYKTALYKRLRELYPIVVTAREIGGVYTEVFTPQDGIAPKNKDRVLINLHGGHFETGSRVASHLESIPIASIGKITVISVDYRMAPEYAFPAASQDVAAVYRELLKTYKPRNIGLYGCSAGGLLTAESIAWFQKEALPLPAAVGMFCAGASYYQEGDSARIAVAIEGFPLEPSPVHPYFSATDPENPLAFPIKSAQTMAKFPPSLLIASTVDVGLSSVAYTQSVLVSHGVEAELHVWEGLRHAFFYDPELPQSREVHDVVVNFFDRHLEK